MDLKEILAISGKSGLFKIIAHTKNGLIVESLLTGNRMPVYASDKISNLEDISIYTTEDEKPLKEVFKCIYDKENGGKSIDHKQDDKVLRAYFEQVLPNYDKERVYVSDIRKVILWYNQLHEKNMLDFTEKPAEEPQAEAQEEKQPDEKTEKEITASEKQKTKETPVAETQKKSKNTQKKTDKTK